jgi:4-amino-4-deoxy-L-arabinose transferase-like glycosyltransferase
MATSLGGRPGTTERWNLAMLVDWVAGSHGRAVALLFAISLLAFLPGFFQISPVDRDEARFAQATKQMVESGDYIDIRFQDESRYKKPVGIYWLQAGVVKAATALGVPRAHVTIGLYRIPSLIGAIGAVLLTYWTALGFVSRRAALLAGVMMASSILLGVEARLAKTDAVLLCCCVAAMGALGRTYLVANGVGRAQHPYFLPAIFWTALAAGSLIKGPLILMFAALAIVTLAIVDRSVRWVRQLKPVPGVLWLILLVLPWFVAIVMRSGMSFFTESVGDDMLAKVGSGQESHGMLPGFYLVLFWVTFFPGAILAGLATPAIWKARREPGAKFLLAWIVPSWIVFEIVATKLPHYVLPLYPAVAILIAGVVDHRGLSQRLWLARGTVWWLLITAGIAAAILATHVVVGQQMGLLAWPFLAGAIIFALRAWWLYGVDGGEHALMRGAAASILLTMAAFGATVPRLPELFPAAQVAGYLRTVGCTPAVVTAGYHEPSLVFLVGTGTRQSDGSGAADFLLGGGCRFAVVEKSAERAFVQRADTVGVRYSSGPRIEGFNIGTGKRVSLAIFRADRG